MGDRVYFAGDLTRQGTYAEYTAIDERLVALAPKSFSDTQAACIPLVALTAWEAFEERLGIAVGGDNKTVLIIGGKQTF